ncbi:MAG: phage terminase large subunit family protein [Thermoguttaceae bacterium]|nr:phage terminase large subunit family protein [Thermoguttaceae bacterium]
MKADIRKLKPVETLRLVNSRSAETLSESRLRRDRARSGDKIGDGSTVDLLKYAAYLTLRYDVPKRLTPKIATLAENVATGYEAIRNAARDRASESVRAAQEIGELPSVKNPERRAKAEASFLYFCQAYFGNLFYLAWSEIHFQIVAKIERVVRNGERFALATPRGTGKTTFSVLAVLWAALTGKTDYVVLIAASSDRAQNLLETIKTWLETNAELAADFPEVCVPIRKLERVAHRQKGQRYLGVPTRIEWGANKIVFPTLEGARTSGVVIQCAGMSGAEIRGLQHARADGTLVRPTLAFVDDPQTRDSARSKAQTDVREQIIKADILGMAGPGKKIALLITTTVVCENDLACRLLDRKKNPGFRGEKYRLLESPPTNAALWDEYRAILEAELANDGDGSQATEFYRANREAMDEGAVASWPARHNDDELSGIQFAMNLKFRDEAAFMSEYQNEPVVVDEGDGEVLSAEEIVAKTSGCGRGAAPTESQILTGFVDVHKDLLFWAAVAWERDFGGAVVDWGVYPEQPKRDFCRLADASPTLLDAHPGAGLEGAIYGALKALTDKMIGDGVPRDDGLIMRFDRVLIDANWGQSTDVVYRFCRRSPHGAILTPSHGVYVGASSRPFSDYRRKRGDLIGPHWRVPAEPGSRNVRRVLIDANFWKSFVHGRLATPEGDVGSLSLSGEERERAALAKHLTAEYRVAVKREDSERRVDEWKIRRGRPDNHWFDCLVGCAVGASMSGAVLPTSRNAEPEPTERRSAPRRVSFAEIQRERRRGR